MGKLKGARKARRVRRLIVRVALSGCVAMFVAGCAASPPAPLTPVPSSIKGTYWKWIANRKQYDYFDATGQVRAMAFESNGTWRPSEGCSFGGNSITNDLGEFDTLEHAQRAVEQACIASFEHEQTVYLDDNQIGLHGYPIKSVGYPAGMHLTLDGADHSLTITKGGK